MPRDFDTALQQADAALQARGMPRDAKLRLDARLFSPPPQRLAMALMGAVSVAVGFVLVAWLAPRSPPAVGGFTVAPGELGHVQVTSEAAVELAEGSAMLDEARGLKVSSLSASTLRRETRGVRLLSGRVTFEVQHVAAGKQPVRVLVSGGAIEVMGTRFTVTERGTGGEVQLHTGKIAFVDGEGNQHQVLPGQTFQWPLPTAPPEDELEPLPPLRPRPNPRKSQEIDWREFDRRVHAEGVITELTQLRRTGAWDDAVRLLERELSRGAPDTRERLSFELGLIYTWQLKDGGAGCAHWAQHRTEYPGGRFTSEVDRASATLGCTP